MHEIGIESKYVKYILDGDKTIEGRLGKSKFLKIKTGELLSIREDIYKDGEIIESIPNQATVKVTQKLYFESFEEMLHAMNPLDALPDTTSMKQALASYRRYYSEADEYEYGVVAIFFELQ